MKDWIAWHEAYADPDSSLSRRLTVVRRRVGEALDALDGAARRALSLCAGDGRDLLPELAARPRLFVDTVLVERNEQLATSARDRARALGLSGVRVLTDDAGDTRTFAEVLPVDLLLLCGIFGNVSYEAVQTTIDAVPAMLAPGGFVIWTRGNSEPDLRPQVRRWFGEAGLDEVAFDGDPEPFGVGLARIGNLNSTNSQLPPRLFTFQR